MKRTLILIALIFTLSASQAEAAPAATSRQQRLDGKWQLGAIHQC